MNGPRSKNKSTLGVILPIAIVGAFFGGIALIWLVIAMTTSSNISAYVEQNGTVAQQSDANQGMPLNNAASEPAVAQPIAPPPPPISAPAVASINSESSSAIEDDEPFADDIEEPVDFADQNEHDESYVIDFVPAEADYQTLTEEEATQQNQQLAKNNSPFGAAVTDDEAEASGFGPIQQPTTQTASTRTEEPHEQAAPSNASPQAIRIANLRLGTINRHRADEDHIQAYRLSIQLERQFPGTPAAVSARQYIKAYEADESFMTKYEQVQNREHRSSLLNLGETAFRNAQWKTSKDALEELVLLYPESDEAKTAIELLSRVNRVLGE